MMDAATTSPLLEEVGSASPPPDWALVPFDVGCARCGEDLRGLTEPKCPACSLAFDWSEAVPIEELTCAQCGYHLYGLSGSRCPECGKAFEWSEALARYHRERLPYFEYRWRDRLVRSFARTWWQALRSGRLWRTMNLHDPPNLPALGGMVLAHVAVSWCAVVIVGAIASTLIQKSMSISWGRQFGISAAGDYFLRDLFRNVTSAWLLRGIGTYAVWLSVSLGALLLFQQSMRRIRVRQAQIVRVWSYSLPMVPSALIALVAVHLVAATWVAGLWSPWADEGIVFGVALLLLVGYSVWSLRQGYRRYLRMPHAFAVAITSQAIAILTTFAIVDLGLEFGISVMIVQTVGDWLGAW